MLKIISEANLRWLFTDNSRIFLVKSPSKQVVGTHLKRLSKAFLMSTHNHWHSVNDSHLLPLQDKII